MFEAMGHNDKNALDLMDANFSDWVQGRVASGEYLGWFIADGDKLVAGAGLWLIPWPPHVLSQTGPRGYILNVYTEPDYRHRGFARRLLSQILEWCQQQKIDVVVLHASHEGYPLYESLGFAPTNEMRLQLSKPPVGNT